MKNFDNEKPSFFVCLFKFKFWIYQRKNSFHTNTKAPSYSGLTLNQLFHRQEAEKKRVDSQRVLEVFL